MRRILLLLGLGVFMGICLTVLGCGRKEATDEKKTKIIFANWESAPTQVSAMEKIVKDFNERHSDIKVIYQISQRPEKILVQIAGGTAPDVFYWQSDMLVSLIDRGGVYNLMPLIKGDKGFNINDYFKALIDSLRYKDGLYGLPTHASPSVLFYNQDIFDKYRIEYPDEEWTWDRYVEVAKKLTMDTNNDGRIDQWGILRAGELECMASQRGLDFFNKEGTRCIMDDPGWKEVIQFNADLGLKHKVTPNVPIFGHVTVAFASQRTAMFVAGGYLIPEVLKRGTKFRWAITLPPHFESEEVRIPLTSGAICIFSKTKHPKECWEFVKFFVGRDGRSKYLKDSVPGYIPVAKSKEFLSLPPSGREYMVKAVEMGKPFQAHPLWREFKTKIFWPQIDAVNLGTITVDEMVEAVTKAGNEMLRPDIH